MKLRCLIVDDEPLARMGIRHLLSKQPQFDIVGEAHNGIEALALIEQYRPHIIFLDVQMPGMTGIQVLENLEFRPAVIFCSAYADYAVSAFEQNALDYLLKPVSPERFNQALLKASHYIIQQLSQEQLQQPVQQPEPSSYASHITIRDPGRLRILDIDDISWIGSAGNYIEIHTYPERKSFLQRDTMANLEKKLNPKIFARVHRSAIVRKSDIVELRPTDKGDAGIILKDGTQLILSRRNRQVLSELLNTSS
ncbi:LytTR family DNA-binding domain-containing protein [Chromatiaceae bacterium AAb-1]|nr:LytTR family DNA-binding domain-containing protein [Chromatiaceae bacterium AAb-1]